MSEKRVHLVLLFAGLLAPLSVFAQTAPTPSESAPTDKVEKIEVTGSHIKRIDIEGVAPVETITRKDIEKTGYDSVSDVIRDTGVNSFGSQRETSGLTTAGNAEVNLRGLGADNTLVLLNGQRLPTDAVTGTVDLNLIPLAAVERIEILKDGASAIYGSDALGGVVNIITRKDFKGTEASITQSVPDRAGGKETNIGVVNGINAEKLNVVTAVNYRYNQGVWSKDRDWSKSKLSQIGSPGSYADNSGIYHADPNCPPSQIQHTPDGDFCRFNTSDYSSEIPSISQIGGLSEANYQLSSDVKLTARVGGTHRLVKWSFAPAPGDFTIPGSVADHLGPGGGSMPGVTPGQDLDVLYRTAILGTRDSEDTVDAYNLLLGSTIQLPNDWAMDITTTNNVVSGKNLGVNGYALTSGLQAAIASGAFNPFGAPGAQGTLMGISYVPTENTFSRLAGAEVKASGDLLQEPAGPVGLAVGMTYTFQSYSDTSDAQTLAGNVLGNVGSEGAGHRNSVAAYDEFSIPLITKKLEFQLASRFDHYSDFGNTFNPKIGLLYHASSDVLLRASVGTGFRAPTMQELYAGSSLSAQSFIDQVACNAERAAGGATPSCLAKQYNTTSSGNSGLKAENSIAYNAGVIYEPSHEFSFSTDAFLTKITNVPNIDYNDLTVAEANGVNPQQYGVTVNRNNAGYITSVVAPLQNLSETMVSGLDIGAAYKLGRFKFSTAQSQILIYKTEGFPGAGFRSKLGWNGNPSWRNTTGVNFDPSDRNEISLTANTIADQQTLDKTGYIGRFTTFDIFYQYKAGEIGTFSFGVKNFIGSAPPTDPSQPLDQVNYSLYDPNGRQFLLGYKKMI